MAGVGVELGRDLKLGSVILGKWLHLSELVFPSWVGDRSVISETLQREKS